jgi:hypothetical protein
MFQRYIAIDRYMNIRAKSGNDNTQLHSNKGHQRHSSAMFFWLGLAIYSKVAFFTT